MVCESLGASSQLVPSLVLQIQSVLQCQRSLLKPNKVLEARHRQNCGRFKKKTTYMGRCKTLQEKCDKLEGGKE